MMFLVTVINNKPNKRLSVTSLKYGLWIHIYEYTHNKEIAVPL